MEIDGEKFKNLVRYLMNNLKALETELLAHRAVLLANGLLEPLAGQLKELRKAGEVREVMDKKYAPFFDALDKQVGQAAQDQAILKLLETWKPTGEPN